MIRIMMGLKPELGGLYENFYHALVTHTQQQEIYCPLLAQSPPKLA